MKKYKILGYLIVLLGLFFNEYTIKIITNYKTKFATIDRSITLILFQVVFISIGYYIVKKKKMAVQNLFILLLSLNVIFVSFEITLTYFWKADLDSDQPLWIPWEYKKLNDEINIKHKINSLKNPFGFNDTTYNINKDNLRIAVLGDSFIWGVGVEDSIIWTHKLKGLFLKNKYDISIMNWGKPGWSTLDQFNFLRDIGDEYEFDFLIFSFVVNDPVLNTLRPRLFIMPQGFVDKLLRNSLGIIYPKTINFTIDLINNFFAKFLNYGYANWLDEILYTETNLQKYSLLLRKIDSYCKEKDFHYVFILTPANHSPMIKKYFDKVISVLAKNNIKYFNLYPIIREKLKDYSVRQLWANPADGHPGTLVTTVIAKSVYQYLISDSEFSHILRKFKNEKK